MSVLIRKNSSAWYRSRRLRKSSLLLGIKCCQEICEITIVPTPNGKDAVEVAKEREEKAPCNCLQMAKLYMNAIGELWRFDFFQVLCAIMLERRGVWVSIHRDCGASHPVVWGRGRWVVPGNDTSHGRTNSQRSVKRPAERLPMVVLSRRMSTSCVIRWYLPIRCLDSIRRSVSPKEIHPVVVNADWCHSVSKHRTAAGLVF